MLLTHITLNTGHTALHRMDTFHPNAVAVCRALLPDGGAVPAFPEWRVTIKLGPSRSMFILRRHGIINPILTGYIAEGSGSWNDLREGYNRTAQKFGWRISNDTAPAGTWLAIMLWSGIEQVPPGDLEWIGDFERCLAAAILIQEPEKCDG